MLLSSASPAQSVRCIGVGIDTSRYGHYACFLREDLEAAAVELAFAEPAAGYQQLRQRVQQIVQRHGAVHFVVRLDPVGQYADNPSALPARLDDRERNDSALTRPGSP